MNPSAYPAAKLLEVERKDLAIRALAGSATIVQNRNFDPLTFKTLDYQAQIQAFGNITDVTDVSLTPFRNKGGKIIMAQQTS